jgi:hypothetical protein
LTNSIEGKSHKRITLAFGSVKQRLFPSRGLRRGKIETSSFPRAQSQSTCGSSLCRKKAILRIGEFPFNRFNHGARKKSHSTQSEDLRNFSYQKTWLPLAAEPAEEKGRS